MKILRKGTIAGNKLYIGECSYCGCKVEFRRSEAEYVADQRDGDCVVIKCPTQLCGQKIWVAK